MTEETRNRITAKGTTDGLIDEIIGYADQVADANAEQEYLKESAKRLNAEKQQMLNDLYEEIIGISKIARSYYRHDPVKRDGFTYSKVLARMRLDRSVEKESPAV
jgi:hypothetical protein